MSDMQLESTDYNVQQIFKNCNEADFWNRRELQERFYGKLRVHEDGTYLEFYSPEWKELGLSGKVTLSFVKATGKMHVPYLYKTYTYRENR